MNLRQFKKAILWLGTKYPNNDIDVKIMSNLCSSNNITFKIVKNEEEEYIFDEKNDAVARNNSKVSKITLYISK